MEMLTEFINKKIKQARYELLEDGTYFGTIPGLRGLWGNADTVEDCKKDLQDALEEWLLFKIYCHEKIPGLKVDFSERPMAIK